MNIDTLSLSEFMAAAYYAFGIFERIAIFAFALLIVASTSAVASNINLSLLSRFKSEWIRIVWIRPPPKPPAKITTSILQHYLMIKLIVYRFASFANVNCHQLIVELFAKPASFRMIVESEFSLKYQINSKLPSL